MCRFSVIVPIYNAEKYLSKCINSVLCQTFKSFEVILINDGSTDKSLEICKRYSRLDSRVRVINKQNEGLIITRKRGIDESIGDYITFVDADDWISKKTLELVNENINEYEADVIVFNMYKVLSVLPLIKKEGTREYFKNFSIVSGNDIKEQLASAYFHGHPFPSNLCGKVYKKNILVSCGNYLNNIKFLGGDLFYNLEVFLNVEKVSLINKALYYYRTGGGTSKYMPYLFDDSIEGYRIQKCVINKYYESSKVERYNGITAMLLNTFKTCLNNLLLSEYDEIQIKKNISSFLENKELIEACENEKKRNYFSKDYIEAITNKNISYLYNMAKNSYEEKNIKKYLKGILR